MKGLIKGATPVERAVRLAGVLAESGIPRLMLTQPDAAPRELRTRLVDLPGLIAAAPDGSVLACADPPLRVLIHAVRLEWDADAPALAQALSSGA